MIKNIFVVVLLFLILVLLSKCKNSEFFTSEKKTSIGFIIPTTSNQRDYKNVLDTDLFKIFIESLKKIKLDENFNYYFIIGFDHDDEFYNKNENSLKNEFNKLKLPNSKIETIKIYNKKGDLGAIWSDLANEASNKCDYFYQLGDDIEIVTPNWENKFIKKLECNNNIGVVGPTDINNSRILTQSFVHKTHLKIFNTYYPKEIKNWHIDDWITEVYKPKFTHKFEDVFVNNKGGAPRYDVKKSDKELDFCLKRDKKIIKDYLKNN